MVLSLRDIVIAAVDENEWGPPTAFTSFHIYYVLELLSVGSMGRDRLANVIGVGCGTIKTVISRLKNVGLVCSTKKGVTLTRRGREVWWWFEQVFPRRVEVSRNVLLSSEFNYGFVVKGQGGKVGSGIEQRDAAIIVGAERAVVFVVGQGGLHVATGGHHLCVERECVFALREIWREIGSQSEGDVVVIAGARSFLKAKMGAFAAAWSLLGD